MPNTDRKPRRRWLRALARIGMTLLCAALVFLLYTALIMGEPDEKATSQAESVPQERIAHSIPSQKTTAVTGVATIAEAFGRPVLTLTDRYPFSEGVVYDTAFEGGFARVASFKYATPSGGTAELRSVRPASALKLLRGDEYALTGIQNAAMAGMNAVCMKSDANWRLHAVADDTLYILTYPDADFDTDAAMLAACVRLVTVPAAN